MEDLKNIIQEYRSLEFLEKESKRVLILLPGNPEIVFKLGIEAIRNNVNFIIGIEDFCLAQNIVNKNPFKEIKFKLEIE